MAKDKAQIIGQVFVFILAGLVFILIIAYGYKAISYFLDQQKQVVLVDFKNDLELAIEGVRRDFGTVRKVTLHLPSEHLGVCFFDMSSCAEGYSPVLSLPSQDISVAWANDACKTGSENVFIVPRVGEKLYFKNLEVSGGYVCIANSGAIELRLEGTGATAKVSQWPRTSGLS